MLAEEEGAADLDALFRSMAKRARQGNLSFFAFTATPKHKTLKVFGRDVNGQAGQAFDRYTMRQAIEEGFILDVLRNYTTYESYFKLLKATDDDPNVERKAAAKELGRFLRLHPYNIAQKTQVMVDHFQAVTRHRIGGRAKAMVVTSSRLDAVRYKQSFDDYIRSKGYTGIKTLVAFSGTVSDPDVPTKAFTEVGMNSGVKEGELPDAFATNEYQVLLVAEKYQTGFDQPLLHTMYVDKKLSGLHAVQTLSRLNRVHPLKEETFVLDFVNDRDEIRKAFAAYYDGAVLGEEVDPARMYQLMSELDASGVYLIEEVQRFCAVFFKPSERQSVLDHQAMQAALDPARARFAVLLRDEPEEGDDWRTKAIALGRLYAFLSQVIPYQDSDLEKLYAFLRHLLPKLAQRKRAEQYHFNDDVRLEYYRLQKVSEGIIELRDSGTSPLDGPKEVGTGKARDERVALSKLIELVNDRFGTDFNAADQLFFDQIVETAAGDAVLRQAAEVNSHDKFTLLVSSLLETLFLERIEQNGEIFARYMNDKPFQDVVAKWVAGEVWGRWQGDLPTQ